MMESHSGHNKFCNLFVSGGQEDALLALTLEFWTADFDVLLGSIP